MSKNILIYDDEEEILFLCKAILKKYGFNVETFLTCDNVISEIDSFHPDVILMDLWIPEIGGAKTVEIIKRNEKTRKIPVLLFSANADIKEICHKVNANGYIKKPFSLNTLLESINRQLV